MLENPHETIVPKGFRHEVGNASIPKSVQRNVIMAYPYRGNVQAWNDLENSVMGSCKTVQTMRNVSDAKARSPNALARGVCQVI